jgi:deoxyribodipyrimidine photolyase
MTDQPALVWFRRDLRIKDNPALSAALAAGSPVVALYILDDTPYFAPGAAQRWFLHHALVGLGDRLARLGVPLILRRGRESEILEAVVREANAAAVWWNCCNAFADRGVLSSSPAWPAAFSDYWRADEKAAGPLLSEIRAGPVRDYGANRNRPDTAGRSLLSQHRALRSVCPLTIWNAADATLAAGAEPEIKGRK